MQKNLNLGYKPEWHRLNSIISRLFGDYYFVVKSIYFDKPEQSNWFVAYHQDLTISVDKDLMLKVLVLDS